MTCELCDAEQQVAELLAALRPARLARARHRARRAPRASCRARLRDRASRTRRARRAGRASRRASAPAAPTATPSSAPAPPRAARSRAFCASQAVETCAALSATCRRRTHADGGARACRRSLRRRRRKRRHPASSAIRAWHTTWNSRSPELVAHVIAASPLLDRVLELVGFLDRVRRDRSPRSARGPTGNRARGSRSRAMISSRRSMATLRAASSRSANDTSMPAVAPQMRRPCHGMSQLVKAWPPMRRVGRHAWFARSSRNSSGASNASSTSVRSSVQLEAGRHECRRPA